jgi:hypothetical protein
MSTYEDLAAFVGEDLSGQVTERLSQAPLDHIGAMLEHLAEGLYNTFDDLTAQPAVAERNRYHLFEPFQQDVPMERLIANCKNLLLYYPATTVPDPLAKLLWPALQVAAITGELVIPDETKFRRELRDALTFLAAISPFVKDGSALLVAESFFIDHPQVQEEARIEIEQRPDRLELDADLSRRVLISGVTVQGIMCKHLDLIPLTVSRTVTEALDNEYLRTAQRNIPNVELRIAHALLSHRLPGTEGIEPELVAKVRSNEPAFAEWRKSFQDVIELAAREADGDDERFAVEMRRASEDILMPKAKDIDKAVKGSPVLTRILTPATLSLGGGAIAAHFTHHFAESAAISAALMPVSWIVEKLYNRYSRSGRSKVVVRELYTHLLSREA